jgi:hypothetical protein
MDQAVIANHAHWVDDRLKPLIDDRLIAVIFNNIRRGTGGKYLNSTYIISKGHDFMEPQGRYDKIFLPEIEPKYTETRKDHSLVVETKYGLIGFTNLLRCMLSPADSGLWSPSGLRLLQASYVNEELLIIHNVDIAGQKKIEVDGFNYRLDFNSIYRPIEGKREFTRI